MRGSPWSAAADVFAAINEGTTTFTAALVREISAALEALQINVGIKPYDFNAELGLTAFADVAAALKARARFEMRNFTMPASTVTGSVSFANSARFTSAPRVFLHQSTGGKPSTHEAYAVSSLTTSGFTWWRRITGNPAAANAQSVRYLAIQLP